MIKAEDYVGVINAMRDWCEDTFEDYSPASPDQEVMACVARRYEGGIDQFVADGES